MTKRVKTYTDGGESKNLLPLGDFHIGHESCDVEKVKEAIQWAEDTDAWILGMGDYIECALRNSPGKSMYSQTMDPQQQIEAVIELLEPVKGQIIGLIDGNHENRATIQTGIKPTWVIGQALGAPYIATGGVLRAAVGKEGYTLYAKHGSTGAATLAGKISAISKLGNIMRDADLYLMGHVHHLHWFVEDFVAYDSRMKSTTHREATFCITGHFLEYEGNYGDEANYKPGVSGYPKITLSGTGKKIHVERG